MLSDRKGVRPHGSRAFAGMTDGEMAISIMPSWIPRIFWDDGDQVETADEYKAFEWNQRTTPSSAFPLKKGEGTKS